MSERPAEAAYRAGLAQAHQDLGIVFRDEERWPEAERELKVAVRICDALSEENSEIATSTSISIDARRVLAQIYTSQALIENAEAGFREALDVAKTITVTHPDVIGYQESLAIILQDHSLLQNNVLRDHASSRASIEQATAIMEKIARDHPTVTRYQVFLARLISSLGVTYEVEHKLSLAKEAFSRSIGILEKFAAEHPQNMKIATTLGTA